MQTEMKLLGDFHCLAIKDSDGFSRIISVSLKVMMLHWARTSFLNWQSRPDSIISKLGCDGLAGHQMSEIFCFYQLALQNPLKSTPKPAPAPKESENVS